MSTNSQNARDAEARRAAFAADVQARTGINEQDATLLMVTHQPEDARRIAGSTVLVDDGRAHPPVPTEALFADPPPALRAYLG